jgi:hypothetical protein
VNRSKKEPVENIMKTRVSVQKKRSAAIAPRIGQQRSGAGFIDNRPEATAQRELNELIRQSPQAVAQRALDERINNGAHPVAQRKLMQSLFGPAMQKTAPEEEKSLQGKHNPSAPSAQPREETAASQKHTDLPDHLKAGIEDLSGLYMQNVKVYYNSSKPADLHALAFTQGVDIHLAPGQERHLPHEAWHVVQQAQGRVQPTMRVNSGMPVNDDQGLEHEADVMGEKALTTGERREHLQQPQALEIPSASSGNVVYQRYLNVLYLDDLIGIDNTKQNLAPLIKAYNQREDQEEKVAQDFYPSFDPRLTATYIATQTRALDGIEALINNWLTANPVNNYNHYVMENLKTNIASDRTRLEAKRGRTDYNIRQGLIKGTYHWKTNDVDLHVDKKQAGDAFPTSDMLIVAEKLYQTMELRWQDGGPVGKFILHPTGAAIVKTVVQLLGEALGIIKSIAEARKSYQARKRKEWALSFIRDEPVKSEDKLDPTVHEEHFQYLSGLRGAATDIDIKAVIPGTRTEAEFFQNIIAATPEGKARLGAYIKTVKEQNVGVSLDVTIYHHQLPKVISVLRGNIREVD